MHSVIYCLLEIALLMNLPLLLNHMEVVAPLVLQVHPKVEVQLPLPETPLAEALHQEAQLLVALRQAETLPQVEVHQVVVPLLVKNKKILINTQS